MLALFTTTMHMCRFPEYLSGLQTYHTILLVFRSSCAPELFDWTPLIDPPNRGFYVENAVPRIPCWPHCVCVCVCEDMMSCR